MKLMVTFINEFTNQSINYEKTSKTTRAKRIQTIYKNAFIILGVSFLYVPMRFLILFVEPSSFETSVSFYIFLPTVFFLFANLHYI